MCTVRTGIHMYDVHTPGQSCVYDPSTSCFQLFVLQNISYRYLFSYPNGGYALPFTFLVSNLNVSHLEYNSPEVYLARTPDAPTARPVFLLAKPRGNYIPNDLHLNSTLEKWKVMRTIPQRVPMLFSCKNACRVVPVGVSPVDLDQGVSVYRHTPRERKVLGIVTLRNYV